VYGGTFRLLDKVFRNFGIEYSILDSEDPMDLERSISEDVKAILLESPANPLMTVTDIAAFSEVAHRKGIKVIVDNTFMTPYLQRPLELGADIVIHSGTKYLGGHSDLIAGLVVVNDQETADRLAFLQNAIGGILQPFDSFLLIRGIKTLSVRMDRHVENAKRLAEYLVNSPDVSKVYYPGLDSEPGYEISKKQAKDAGAMLSFELEPGHDLNRFFESLELISLAESLGGVESLVCHPATMTHASIPEDIRKKVGISNGLIRLSPGLESADDLIRDLDHAIKESRKA
jgi:cystathionine beta-lyase